MSPGVDLRLPDWPEVPYLAKDAVVSHANVKIVSAKVRRVTILADFLNVNRDFVCLTQGHYLQLNGAVLAAASPLLSEVLTSALSSCDTCHHIQDVVIHSGEKNKHSTTMSMGSV